MTVPKVTIGVPVYNGAQSLHECLTVLQNQTLEDIEVLIFDNHSQDATAEIALAFAENDPRFRYHRHPATKSAEENFADCLAAAQAPYFMWRAHDDTSSANYAEHLSGILDQCPEAMLAVSGGTWQDWVSNTEKRWVTVDSSDKSLFVKLLYQARYISAYWWYGLYRTDWLRTEMGRDWDWQLYHSDMIFLCHVVSTGRVESRPGAMFYFRRIAPKTPPPYPTEASVLGGMAKVGIDTVDRNLNQLVLPWAQKQIVRLMFLRMVDRKVVRFKRLFKARLLGPRAA